MKCLCLVFSKKCEDVQATKNFAEYISFLKIALNTRTINNDIMNRLFLALLKFVQKPTLFDNKEQLAEADKLHQKLYERITEKPGSRFKYDSSKNGQKEFK